MSAQALGGRFSYGWQRRGDALMTRSGGAMRVSD